MNTKNSIYSKLESPHHSGSEDKWFSRIDFLSFNITCQTRKYFVSPPHGTGQKFSDSFGECRGGAFAAVRPPPPKPKNPLPAAG